MGTTPNTALKLKRTDPYISPESRKFRLCPMCARNKCTKRRQRGTHAIPLPGVEAEGRAAAGRTLVHTITPELGRQS